jgi:hypothetical protein
VTADGLAADSVTGTDSVVAPELPSPTEASPTEIAAFVTRRTLPLTHA